MAYSGHPDDHTSRKIKSNLFWIDFSKRFWVKELYVRDGIDGSICAAKVETDLQRTERYEGYSRVFKRDVWMTIVKDGVEWARFPRERDARLQRDDWQTRPARRRRTR